MPVTTPTKAPAATQLEALLARDRWSREQLITFQHERLREVIEHAATASPFYREVLGGDALPPDVRIEDLPTVTKATLMEQFERVVTDPRLRLAAAGGTRRRTRAGALLGDRYHVFTTSGTTGRRGVFPQTPAEFGHWLDVAGRTVHRAGLDSTARAGEVLSRDASERIEAAWGVVPIEIYATTEALMLAAESEDRGTPGYKVLVTSLVGRTLPLIRYGLADSVTLAAGPDPSDRPYRRIQRIDERNDDSSPYRPEAAARW